jgi:hypothetical protein
MKKLIKFLAEISGVEKQIRSDERQQIAQQIQDTAYWFTNYYKYYKGMYPFLTWMSGRLKYNYGINGGTAREQLDIINKTKIVNDNGYWVDFEFIDHIGMLSFQITKNQK